MNVACQIRDTKTRTDLPRVVFDADMHHDAERAYCEKFNIEPREVGTYKSLWHRYYWLESQETTEEWDQWA